MSSNPSRRRRPTPTPCSSAHYISCFSEDGAEKCRRERPARAGTTTTHAGQMSPLPSRAKLGNASLLQLLLPLSSRAKSRDLAFSAHKCYRFSCVGMPQFLTRAFCFKLDQSRSNSSPSWHRSLQLSCRLLLQAPPGLRDTRSYHTASQSRPSCHHRPGQTDVVHLDLVSAISAPIPRETTARPIAAATLLWTSWP